MCGERRAGPEAWPRDLFAHFSIRKGCATAKAGLAAPPHEFAFGGARSQLCHRDATNPPSFAARSGNPDATDRLADLLRPCAMLNTL